MSDSGTHFSQPAKKILSQAIFNGFQSVAFFRFSFCIKLIYYGLKKSKISSGSDLDPKNKNQIESDQQGRLLKRAIGVIATSRFRDFDRKKCNFHFGFIEAGKYLYDTYLYG